ncbi:MAG: recombination protein RecR [Omnitrophica WOR_2 bacterium RIFCSPLOWO2_12_FULL_50_9]|nr:MAG: recombination protein RecR [Omnitrophica WOR_2 bacterium RIFCSPHIGHO2_02_FULL_50_17]OGX41138.1 MAG: recombination protein RecR [Omnitrophica WOR_2 bacterium RIFCSPLOWO2_12_FULL_50_9]
MSYPKLIENLIAQFSKFPGIGRRSAERMVFWVLNHPQEEVEAMAKSLLALKEGLRFCRLCNNLSDTEICLVCSDTSRDDATICVVEEPKDVLAIERTGSFKGHYHVLLGAISPADGRGPEDLKIQHLLNRVHAQNIKEVVIATDPDNEGEMTALYLTKQLRPTGVKISRIGLGIPVGSSLEYADLSTLSMSLQARREITDHLG